MRRTFLQLVGIERHQVIFEPIVKEGHNAMAVLEMHKPKLYIGFDYRRDNLELAAATLGVKPGECTKGICLIHASTICDAVPRIKNIAPWGVDAVLLLHTLYWLIELAESYSALPLLRERTRSCSWDNKWWSQPQVY